MKESQINQRVINKAANAKALLPPLKSRIHSHEVVVLVALLVSSRRRVARLEEALTPEELLMLSDVGMSDEIRQQTVANIEWLKSLPGDIPHMTTDVLRVIWEELEKARTMYERAFELEPVATEAGEQLRKTLLDRIDFLLGLIDREVESRA